MTIQQCFLRKLGIQISHVTGASTAHTMVLNQAQRIILYTKFHPNLKGCESSAAESFQKKAANSYLTNHQRSHDRIFSFAYSLKCQILALYQIKRLIPLTLMLVQYIFLLFTHLKAKHNHYERRTIRIKMLTQIMESSGAGELWISDEIQTTKPSGLL